MEASQTGWAGTQRQAAGPRPQPALAAVSRKAGFSTPLVSCWNAPPQGGCFRFVLRFADDKHVFHPAQNIRRLDRWSELILSEPLVDPISAQILRWGQSGCCWDEAEDKRCSTLAPGR